VKNELLGEDALAVEMYPPAPDVVDEANIRHLWEVPPDLLPFGLHRRGEPLESPAHTEAPHVRTLAPDSGQSSQQRTPSVPVIVHSAAASYSRHREFDRAASDALSRCGFTLARHAAR
jgi:hypothetical protein